MEEEERKKNMKAKNPQFWRSTKSKYELKGQELSDMSTSNLKD